MLYHSVINRNKCYLCFIEILYLALSLQLSVTCCKKRQQQILVFTVLVNTSNFIPNCTFDITFTKTEKDESELCTADVKEGSKSCQFAWADMNITRMPKLRCNKTHKWDSNHHHYTCTICSDKECQDDDQGG